MVDKSLFDSLHIESVQEKHGFDLTDPMFDQDGQWVEQNIHPLWEDEGSLLDDAS